MEVIYNKTMKEIHKLILKEKQKQYPNKEYIQWLQQVSDENLTEHFLEEVKEKMFLKKLHQENTITMDQYLKGSNKQGIN